MDTTWWSTRWRSRRTHARQLLRLDVGALVVISSAAVYRGAQGSYLEIAVDADTFPDYPVPISEDWPTVDNDETTYSPLKASMERVLLQSDAAVSILRAGAIHGPYSPGLREWYYIKRALDGRRRCVLAWDGGGRFHPAATVNIAELVRACADAPGRRVVNAVDDEAPTDAEIATTVFEVLGQEVELLSFPGPPRGTLGDSPWAIAKPFVLSMERAHQELGYRPAVTYRGGVELDVEWVQRTLAGPAESDRGGQEGVPLSPAFGPDSWFDYEAEDAFRG